MNRLMFRPDEYASLYNCSQYSPQQWHSFGRPDKVLGGVYMSIGFMYEVLYFPCLFTMSKRKFMRLSCYKIMFYLGIIDVACISINSIIDGYFQWHGNVFCDHPRLMYISGGVSTGLWCAACMACMMLAINRLCDLMRPQWMERLFGGSRTYFWLLAPTLYGLYFIFFTPPLIYSSVLAGAFFDPYMGTPIKDTGAVGRNGTIQQASLQYTSWPHTINNFVVIIVLITAYTCVCVVVLLKSRLMGASTDYNRTMSGAQKTIIMQATMICMLILVAATVYVRMQFFETAGYMVVVGQITWQSSHGGAVFIYLFLNKSMRNEVRRTFCCTPDRVVASETHTKMHSTGKSTQSHMMSGSRDSASHEMF